MAKRDIENYKLSIRLYIYARDKGVPEKVEDEFLDYLDTLWDNMTPEEHKTINEFSRGLLVE